MGSIGAQSEAAQIIESELQFDADLRSLLRLSLGSNNIGKVYLLTGYAQDIIIENEDPSNFSARAVILDSVWSGEQIYTNQALLYFQGEKFAEQINDRPVSGEDLSVIGPARRILFIAELLEPLRQDGQVIPQLRCILVRNYQ